MFTYVGRVDTESSHDISNLAGLDVVVSNFVEQAEPVFHFVGCKVSHLDLLTRIEMITKTAWSEILRI